MGQYFSMSIVPFITKVKEKKWQGQITFCPDFRRKNGDLVTRTEADGETFEEALKALLARDSVKECLELMKEEAEKAVLKLPQA